MTAEALVGVALFLVAMWIATKRSSAMREHEKFMHERRRMNYEEERSRRF